MKIMKKSLIILLLLLSFGSFSACQAKLSQEMFPLYVDYEKKSYFVGDKITIQLGIKNESTKDIQFATGSGMPCAYIYHIDEQNEHGHYLSLMTAALKANETYSNTIEYVFEKSGTYLLKAHCDLTVNGKNLEPIVLDAIEIHVNEK